MRLIPQDNDALRLLTAISRSCAMISRCRTPDIRHLVTTHVYDLMAMASAPPATAPPLRRSAACGRRDLRLSRPTSSCTPATPALRLSPWRRARGFRRDRCSCCSRVRGTFSQFVIEQRLARAHRMLTDPRHAGSTVIAIALASGFGDLSHFHRSFRRRYGATPSDVRAAGLSKD